MRYFYDTEFLEDGKTIELISIGIVAQDGRELYLINDEVDDGLLHARLVRHPWLMKNVIPHLPLKPGTKARGPEPFLVPDVKSKDTLLPGFFALDGNDNRVMPLRMIRNAVRDFLLHDGGNGELWADYGAYDHVALCQLFGPMIGLPDGIPMFTNEFQQAWRARGCPTLPKQADGVHNALEDARHLAKCWQVIHRPSEPWPEPRAEHEKTWGDQPQ